MKNLPAFACVPGCSACCKASLVPCTTAEKHRIAAVRPDLEWTPWGEGEWVMTDQLETMACPLLTPEGRCSVHSIRPVRCQVYGLRNVPGWICKNGGKAERMLTEKEARVLMHRAKRPA